MTKSHGWAEDKAAAGVLAARFPESAMPRCFVKGSCRVILTREPQKDGVDRLHLSISHPARYPSWEEIKDARYTLMPFGCLAAMLLPPPHEYVNVHPNCFHLYEIIDPRVHD